MKEPRPVQLKGHVKRITFANPENGYTVAKVEISGRMGLTTLVGRMPGLIEGQEVQISGKESDHPKFGPPDRGGGLPHQAAHRCPRSGALFGLGAYQRSGAGAGRAHRSDLGHRRAGDNSG